MAVVLNIGGWRGKPVLKRENWAERYLENPFLKAELARVEISRADHPSLVSDKIVRVLFVWAMIHNSFSACWFVKYVI
ncbi:hypothetical protein IT084_16630 [Desulfallas sp. Bu1-1]|uniref:hypothetical protein n=1 Tax=Desulfallas sp. Bu1-1 TaxID=2787620 RepID=UPI0018A03942|nr:hypothetical protein [Desulfallas sp. Bu1-1]MBF7084565.1 hypothetical protein [Desulfallas sp. Bu1-1]